MTKNYIDIEELAALVDFMKADKKIAIDYAYNYNSGKYSREELEKKMTDAD